jgi:hypothetical protein
MDESTSNQTEKLLSKENIKDAALFGAEFIPGVGEALAIKRTSDALGKGDYVGAGIEATAGLLGVIPGVGDLAGKGLRTATKAFRKADVEEAEKLIDNPEKLQKWRDTIDKGGNRLPESQRQKNIPEAEQAAEDLFQGNIKSKEARKRIKEVFPEPELYTAETMPEMPTITDVVGSMGKKSEKGILGVKGFDLKPGQRVGARLDIPAYNEYDKWVVSIHDGNSSKGKVVGYGQAIRLKNIEFGSDPKIALDIARKKVIREADPVKGISQKRMGKATIARVLGDYVPEDPYELQEFARKILADKDSSWTQVGMNPYRGSYFYDKATGIPVTRADEVIQVGPLVLAKNVTKPKMSELKEMFKPVARTAGGKLRIFNEGGLSTDYEDRIISEEVRRKMDDAVAKAEAEGIEVESEYYRGSDLDKMKEFARLNDIGVITGPFADFGRGVNVPRTPTLFNLFAMEEELSHNRQPEDPDPKKGSRPRFKAGPSKRLLNLKGLYDEEVRAKDEALEKTGGLLPKGKRTAELTRRSYAEMFKNGINKYVEETGDTETVKELFKQYPELRNVEEIKRPEGFKQGGAVPMNNMAKQMELFDEGGLMDEGGTIDPVSGNDVPPGSTQEEVRDDIPAQLSEGEFVFPADVVRFIGLEKLMKIRQRAKAGLRMMEEMGQMGNSEEAIMPDDLPFSIDDLDMEDDGLEMNQGGLVNMSNGGTVGQIGPPSLAYTGPPGIFGTNPNPNPQGLPTTPTTGTAPAPMQAASSGGVDPNLGGTAFTPTNVQPIQQTFQQAVGAGVPGVDFEYVEYVNESGQIVRLRRNKNTGEMLDPIPEGFTQKTDATQTQTTTGTGVQTAKVADDGDGGAGDEGIQSTASVTLGGVSGTGRQKGLRVGDYKTFGVSYNVPGGLPGMAGAFSTVAGLAFGKGLPAGATANIFDRDFPKASITVSAKDFNAMKALDYKGELADMYKDALNITAGVLDNKVTINENGQIVDGKGNPVSDKTQGLVQRAVVGSVLDNVKTSVPSFLDSINNFGKVSFEEAVANANDAQKSVLDNMGVDYDPSLEVTAEEKADMARQEEIALAEALARANQFRASRTDPASTPPSDMRGTTPAAPAPAPDFASDPPSDMFDGGSDFGGFDDVSATGEAEDEGDFAFKSGGLASQMKRSELASKK